MLELFVCEGIGNGNAPAMIDSVNRWTKMAANKDTAKEIKSALKSAREAIRNKEYKDALKSCKVRTICAFVSFSELVENTLFYIVWTDVEQSSPVFHFENEKPGSIVPIQFKQYKIMCFPPALKRKLILHILRVMCIYNIFRCQNDFGTWIYYIYTLVITRRMWRIPSIPSIWRWSNLT